MQRLVPAIISSAGFAEAIIFAGVSAVGLALT
jgi:hypothetical protein